MALTHIIAHRIQRLTPGEAATIKVRETCWSQNGRIEECFRELKLCVMKRFSKEYGRFSDDHASHPLSSWLGQYSDEKMGFESVSKNAMTHFKTELDKTEALVDGFVFFAHEVLEHESVIHVFFVQHNTGQFIDGELDLSESFYLDTSNVCLAAKINMTDWQSGDTHRASSALTLLRWRGEKELSDVFVDVVGFAEKIDVSADTEEFLSTVASYTKDLPEEVAFQTKKQVVDYCLEQDKVGKPVVMAELSRELKETKVPFDDNNGEADTVECKALPDFAAFVAQSQPVAKPELIPDKSQLRQFVRISGRDNNLSMSFTSSCLGDSIVYDPDSDSLTINNIPASLKTRLAKHLQGR